jgi:hypothetical protein
MAHKYHNNDHEQDQRSYSNGIEDHNNKRMTMTRSKQLRGGGFKVLVTWRWGGQVEVWSIGKHRTWFCMSRNIYKFQYMYKRGKKKEQNQ